MTVSVAIINVGNHPEDRVSIHRENGTTVELGRGQSIFVDAPTGKMGQTYGAETLHHGSGEDCRNHAAMAGMVEGPGRDMVRGEFNPSGSDDVAKLKSLAIAFINEVEAVGKDGRLTALAKTAAEEAAMWAVKSATATD